MQLSKIVCRAVNLPFRFAFGHSLASRNHSVNIIVEATLSDGEVVVSGLGESVPRHYVTGETADTVLTALNKRFIPQLLGREFASVDALLLFIQHLFFEEGLDQTRGGASFAALELAIVDACARYLGRPLYAMPAYISALSGKGPNIWNDNLADSERFIKYGGVVPFGKQKTLAALLYFYRMYGFSTVKLKVGGDPDGDVVKVKLAREIMGDHALIRVDANCAWDISQAERTLERMRPCGIASVEQPLKPFDNNLPFLKRQIPEVIVADESLTTFTDAKNLIETRACGAFNIRLSKVGGIFAAMRLVEMAQNASLECHLGAQVGESGILASAQRHFALAWPHFANIEGAMNLFLLKRDLTSECETVPLGACASVRARDGRGLGVTLKRSLMQKLTIGGAR